MGVHRLTCANTLWVFVTCSNEPRHLDDVVFGVATLRKRGVADDKIVVVLDHPRPEKHLDPYGIPKASSTDDLVSVLKNVPPVDYVAVVVGGHGHARGIGNQAPPATNWPSHKLFRAIRKIRGLKGGIAIFAQCYGGVFNFADVRTDPPLVALGATNLNPSLSLPITLNQPITQEDGTPGLREWMGNIFLASFFEWLASPTDVDGDGHLTLMDGYKHAGVESNRALRNAKALTYVRARRLADSFEDALKATQASPSDRQLVLIAQATGSELEQALEVLYLHQEPWILNADMARNMRFQ